MPVFKRPGPQGPMHGGDHHHPADDHRGPGEHGHAHQPAQPMHHHDVHPAAPMRPVETRHSHATVRVTFSFHQAGMMSPNAHIILWVDGREICCRNSHELKDVHVELCAGAHTLGMAACDTGILYNKRPHIPESTQQFVVDQSLLGLLNGNHQRMRVNYVVNHNLLSSRYTVVIREVRKA